MQWLANRASCSGMVSLAEPVRVAAAECLRSELPEYERYGLPETCLGHCSPECSWKDMLHNDILSYNNGTWALKAMEMT
jgi:hypothetical protein